MKQGKKGCGKTLPEGVTMFRCLCVRPPYARAIVTGKKIEEYRSRPTRIRGRVGIIESGSGKIIGDAVLADCTEREDGWEYVWHFRQARVYAAPVAYRHPVGAVVWVNVPCRWRRQQP